MKIIANPGALRTATSWLEACGKELHIPQHLLLRLQLVIEELILNTVKHGHFAESSTDILLGLERLQEKIVLTYTDHSEHFNPLAASLPPPKPGTRGVGLILIQRLPDEVAYKALTTEQGNEIKMLFYFTPNRRYR